MNKQIISLIGGLVAAGVLVLAFIVGVVPQLTAANSTNSQADQVDATNRAYQVQITSLRKAEDTIDETRASVAQLHTQISSEPLNWQVFRQIAAAADASNATVQSITADDPGPFVKQTGPVTAGSPTPGPSPTPSATASAGSNDGTSATTTPSASNAADSRQQVPFTIAVTVRDAKAAIEFLDGLRQGPRLISTVSTAASSSSENSLSLDVNALAFVEATGEAAK